MMNIPRSNPVEGSSGRSHILLPALTAAILAILISGVGICHARNFLSAVLNSYRDGDNLDRTKVSYMPPGPSGPDQIWDTGYTGILGQYVSGVSVFPDSVIVSTPDAIYYYKENTDSLSLTGYENRKSRISYDTPRLIRPSDMQYGDSVSGYYSGRGSYCGRLDLDISGFQYSVAVNEDAGRHDLNMELTRQPTGNVVVVHVEAAGLHDSRKVYKEHV